MGKLGSCCAHDTLEKRQNRQRQDAAAGLTWRLCHQQRNIAVELRHLPFQNQHVCGCVEHLQA